MPIRRHFLLSSNRWYSAATEYALRVCEYLHRQGEHVQILSHAGSPLLSKGKALGIDTAVLALRRANGRALGLFGLIYLFVTLFRMLHARDEPGSGGSSSKLYVWVLEGHEHALVSLLRGVFVTLRKRTVLVRLRMQDRFDGGGFFANLIAHGTDFIVFPSEYARARFFEGRTSLAAAYFDKVLVQYFCKDFAPPLVSVDLSTAKPPELFDLTTIELDCFTFVAVARFDPIKGLALLIEAFVAFARSRIDSGADACRNIRLVIIGRSENIKADSLWQHASRILGSQRRQGNCYFAESTQSASEISVILVDEVVSPLSVLLRRCDCAVISSLGSEVICRTAVEFLQMGLPIVSTEVGSLPETIGPEFSGDDGTGCGFYAAVAAAAEQSERQHVVAALTRALTRAYVVFTDSPGNANDNDFWRVALNERCRMRGGEFGLAGFKTLVDRVMAAGAQECGS